MINVNNLQLNTTMDFVLKTLKNESHNQNKEIFKDFKDSDDHIQTQCPFHKDGHERKPSFGVNKKTGLWHCFTCGEKGSLPTLVQKVLNLDNYKAGEQWLIDHFDTSIIVNGERPKLQTLPDNNKLVNILLNKKVEPVKEISKNNYITEEELKKYRFYHPYMYQRGLTNDIIQKFDIGYDKDFKFVLKKEPLTYSNPIPSITFPVKDIEGNCLFIARRAIYTKLFYYPNNVEKPLYGAYEIKKYYDKGQNELYICESMLDALKLFTVGKLAVALNGLGSNYQFQLLKNMPQKLFILATDNDERGLAARQRIRYGVGVKNKVFKQVIIPKGKKDINDCSIEELQNLPTKLI